MGNIKEVVVPMIKRWYNSFDKRKAGLVGKLLFALLGFGMYWFVQTRLLE